MTLPSSHVTTSNGYTRLWSADQHFFLSISVVEDERESYTPQGIDVGIDLEGFAGIPPGIVERVVVSEIR